MLKINKILYATDLSESAKSALGWAMSLAEQYDAEITIIHTIPDVVEEIAASVGYDLAAHFDIKQLSDLNKEGQHDALNGIKERIKSVCGEVKDEFPSCRMDFNRIIIKAGHPVQEIIAAATDGQFDVIVMGTHGHSLIDEFFLGSVARGVVHKSPIPVLTIRLPGEEKV